MTGRPIARAGRGRTPAEVMQDHLLRWRNGDLEGDLARNYDRSVLTLMPGASLLGWSGPRALEADLGACAPGRRPTVEAVRMGGCVATVSWMLADEAGLRAQGVDGFFIHAGRIFTHTREVVRHGGSPR